MEWGTGTGSAVMGPIRRARGGQIGQRQSRADNEVADEKVQETRKCRKLSAPEGKGQWRRGGMEIRGRE